MALFGGRNRATEQQPNISFESVPLFTTRTGRDTTLSVTSVNSWEGLMYGLNAAAAEIGIDSGFKPTREDVYSIPDVFAELRAINAALEDADNTLHHSAVADWRAVLTVLLLHKELNVTVEIVDIDFRNLSEFDAMFLHTAAEYLPGEYEGKISVFLTLSDTGEKVPFAFSSPGYFVCPAKEIRARLLIGPEIAEFDGSRTILKDPAAFLHSNPAYGFRVAELLTEANQTRRVRNAKTLIVDFIRSINVPKYADARLASGKMLIADWADLDAAKSGDTGLSDELIFTDEICLFQAADAYAAQKNIAVLSYEEVFQDAMADHRVLTDDGKTAYYALLPYRKEFLQEKAYTEDGQPNAAIFRGVTMLKKTEGNSNYIEVSLLYDKIKYSTRYDESKWLEPSPQKRSFPPLSVWPNSRDDAGIWSVYYTFSGLRFDEDEDAHNWLALDFSALTFDNRKIVETEGDRFIEQHNVAAKKYIDCEYEIIQTGTYPHVLLGKLAESGKHVGAYAMTSGGQGINTVPDRTAIIGIDFGTSNTVAFYSMHNGDTLEQPKPIDFKNANVQAAIVNDVFDKMSSRFFISRKELTGDVSFPTILHVSDKKNTKPDLFHGANIYFRGNEEKGGSDVEIMKVPNLETDIKWSTDAAKRTWTYKFVTELAVFCAWQAASKTQAGNLEWRFSFPSSISNADDFTGALKAAAQEAAKIVFGNKSAEAPKIDLTSESHAAGLYFMNQPIPSVNRDKGFISIDIGGGSTDISIWQNDITRAKAEASVKFAGKDILTNNAISLCEDTEMTKLWSQMGVGQSVIDNVIASIEGADIEPHILFDTMLAIASRQLEGALRINNGQRPLSNVIKLITFNLSMLVALAGSMLRELLANDIFDLRDELKLVFCGNGSKTRNWLQADNNKIMERVLRDIVGKDLRDVRIVFEQSKNPKQEVAAGLVSVVKLRDEAAASDPIGHGDDILAQKVIIGGNGERDPHVAEEVILLFGGLYDILSSDDLNFGLNKYRSFKEKESFLEKMRSAVSALDPVGTGYARITYAQAFVKCAQVANNILISDMKEQ